MSETGFSKRRIDVTFTMPQTTGAAQSVTLSGYRVGCRVLSTGLETGMTCALRIEGMAQDMMNRLSVAQAGMATQGRTLVSVRAGTGQGVLPVIFTGGVVEAFAQYAAAPDTAFHIQAQSTALPAALPVSATSFAADVPVPTIMRALADKAGLAFSNNGVGSVLRGGVYYKGAAAEQMDSCARAAGIAYHVGLDTLSIWPMGMAAAANPVTVSPATGLIGYPSYSQYGVALRTVFNPDIHFRGGIRLDSGTATAGVAPSGTSATPALHQPASGVWVVSRLMHDLQAEVPGGTWMTDMEAARPDRAGQGFAY